jgi:hypothetical protein
MTTRFSQIAKDWELTKAEIGFLSATIIQIRKSEIIASDADGQTSFVQALETIRACAYEADVQYRRTFYPGHRERTGHLDRVDMFLTAILIKYWRIGPILEGFAEEKKGATR